MLKCCICCFVKVTQEICQGSILNIFFCVYFQSASPLDVEDSDSMSISLSTNKAHLTPQLLLLYYVMLYEDVRLNNLQTLGRIVRGEHLIFIFISSIFLLIQDIINICFS